MIRKTGIIFWRALFRISGKDFFKIDENFFQRSRKVFLENFERESSVGKNSLPVARKDFSFRPLGICGGALVFLLVFFGFSGALKEKIDFDPGNVFLFSEKPGEILGGEASFREEKFELHNNSARVKIEEISKIKTELKKEKKSKSSDKKKKKIKELKQDSRKEIVSAIEIIEKSEKEPMTQKKQGDSLLSEINSKERLCLVIEDTLDIYEREVSDLEMEAEDDFSLEETFEDVCGVLVPLEQDKI